MGTQISAKYDGYCKICGSTWKVNDSIFYQKNPKAICAEKECFKEQGGTLFDQKSFSGSRNESIVTNLPECTVPDEVKKLTDILDPIFLTAHHWTKDRYPAEEVTSDRFGRIRSQNMGFLLQLALIYLKKDNE